MKKTMTMIVFILALGSQAIAGGLSVLKLRTNSNMPLKVILDGRVVSDRTEFVNLEGVRSGKHTLQVLKMHRTRHRIHEEVVFFGEIYLPQNTVTQALIKHHKFLIEQQFAFQQRPNHRKPANHRRPSHTRPNQRTPRDECGRQGNNNGYSQQYNQVPNNVAHHVAYTQGTNYVYQPPVVEVLPMDAQNFNMLKATIENQWFSDGKREIVTQAINEGNLFTTNQVKQLIALFSFSGDRLKVAKMAYLNTVDKENYFQVNNSLQWTSSVENLGKYIASL